jgi:hypothetical protein
MPAPVLIPFSYRSQPRLSATPLPAPGHSLLATVEKSGLSGDAHTGRTFLDPDIRVGPFTDSTGTWAIIRSRLDGARAIAKIEPICFVAPDAEEVQLDGPPRSDRWEFEYKYKVEFHVYERAIEAQALGVDFEKMWSSPYGRGLVVPGAVSPTGVSVVVDGCKRALKVNGTLCELRAGPFETRYPPDGAESSWAIVKFQDGHRDVVDTTGLFVPTPPWVTPETMAMGVIGGAGLVGAMYRVSKKVRRNGRDVQ